MVGEAGHRRRGGSACSEAWEERSVTLQTGCWGESLSESKRGIRLFV